MPSRLLLRPLAITLFVVCASLLAAGLYIQHVQGIEPCPMCIMQRYALAACGLVGLVAGLHNPRRAGQNAYAALLAAGALAGGGVAARQSWMQWYPPAVSECGPGLEYMLESFPLSAAPTSTHIVFTAENSIIIFLPHKNFLIFYKMQKAQCLEM